MHAARKGKIEEAAQIDNSSRLRWYSNGRLKIQRVGSTHKTKITAVVELRGWKVYTALMDKRMYIYIYYC